MKHNLIRIISIAVVAVLICLIFSSSMTIFAAGPEDTETIGAIEEEKADGVSSKAIASAVVVGLAAAAGALGMGIAIAKSTDSMARQPEASGRINSSMMLGLVFIETTVIYALVVAILIIFVL